MRAAAPHRTFGPSATAAACRPASPKGIRHDRPRAVARLGRDSAPWLRSPPTPPRAVA